MCSASLRPLIEGTSIGLNAFLSFPESQGWPSQYSPLILSASQNAIMREMVEMVPKEGYPSRPVGVVHFLGDSLGITVFVVDAGDAHRV